jgi:transcriptional regulator of acetoin/glycerol metabolism
MVADLVRKTGERLSNHLFRRRHADNTLLKARSEAGAILLAINDNAQVVGANQLARRWLNLAEGPLQPQLLASLFHVDAEAQAQIYQNGRFVVHHQDGDAIFKISRKVLSTAADQSGSVAKKPKPSATDQPTRDGVPTLTVEECLGNDPRMAKQLVLLQRVSGSGLPILVLGETGCGKDTLARALHVEGGRRHKPFVAFNCAAVPETLIDSELFGYTVGAFTGARREGNVGRLVEADGGTLFLDELGDMPLALQTRLLRVLESGEVSPLGAGKTRIIDVQVIAATNQDLKTQVAEGRFRADLYHRLAGVVVNLLPVRERDDAVPLFDSMLQRLNRGQPVTLSTAAVDAMRRHRWPGNLREVKFTLQRALQLCDGQLITPADLLIEEDEVGQGPVAAPTVEPGLRRKTATEARASAERAAIADALFKNDGNIGLTATTLNVSRATLYRKLKLHNLRR